MNSLDDVSLLPLAAAFGENIQNSFSHPTFNLKTTMDASPTSTVRPAKQPKLIGFNACKTDHMPNPQSAFPPNILSFVNSNHMNQMEIVKPKEEAVCSRGINTLPADILVSQSSFGNQNYVFKTCQEAKKISTSTRLSQSQDHIIAERKRREKLSQRFIALSAIVPGLKKVFALFTGF